MSTSAQSPSGQNQRNGDIRSLRAALKAGKTDAPPAPKAPARWDDEAPRDDERIESVADGESAEIIASLRRQQQGGRDRAAQLRVDNEKLRNTIQEMRQQLDQAAAQDQGGWEERERHFESQLEDKSEEIRMLYIRIQELEREHGGGGGGAPSGRVDDDERSALLEELQREEQQLAESKQTLEDERRQIREDEEDLMRRMREMELQTAKSRAELVRTRNELQVLHNEVRAELEQAQQTGANVERVRSLQRNHQEISSRKAR